MNLLLIGACGRMGKAVASLGKVAVGVDRTPAPMPFPVFRSLAEVSAPVDVAVDFSSAENLEERLLWCEAHGVPVVIGTTGFSERDFKRIEKASERIAVFQSGNLSLGAALLAVLTEQAAKFLGSGFDAEIIERHHRNKKDAPSGTALLLADSAERGFGEASRIYGRKGTSLKREQNEIGIHAVRGGNIVGEHEVMFAGKDEIITLSHSARSRTIFARGALRAAEWLIGKPAGRYSMQDLISLC